MPARKTPKSPKTPAPKSPAVKRAAERKRHLVCLTFNLDGLSGFIARGQVSPAWISRGEFGPRVGMPRLVALLKQYDIKSTWFVPGHTIETFPKQCEQVVSAGHEIAHHGWTHRSPAILTREQEEGELVRANASIKWLTGRNARGYRSPSRDLSSRSVELMLKQGFLYDSTLTGDDCTPYFARSGDIIELERRTRFGKPTPLVEMPVHWAADDALAGENGIGDLEYMCRNTGWGVLTCTCNPSVIGRGSGMTRLENFIKAAIRNKAVFMTMEDAVAEFKQRNA